VPNLGESIAWYQKMLGFEIVRRVNPNGNVAIGLLRRNDCYIELFQVANAQPLPESRRSPTADLAVHGIKHFALEVADARGAAAALKARGAEISGNAFELIQYKRQQGAMLIALDGGS
jgi:hypothetical protein